MNVMLKVEVVSCEKAESDFEHEGVFYRFVEPKVKEAYNSVGNEMRCFVDCVDDEPVVGLLFAEVYFGDYGFQELVAEGDMIVHDTEVLFVKEPICEDEEAEDEDEEASEKRNFNEHDVLYVSNLADLDAFVENYAWLCATDIWVRLCEIMGEDLMLENAAFCADAKIWGKGKEEVINRFNEASAFVNSYLDFPICVTYLEK